MMQRTLVVSKKKLVLQNEFLKNLAFIKFSYFGIDSNPESHDESDSEKSNNSDENSDPDDWNNSNQSINSTIDNDGTVYQMNGLLIQILVNFG